MAQINIKDIPDNTLAEFSKIAESKGLSVSSAIRVYIASEVENAKNTK